MKFTAASDQSLQVTLGEGISRVVNAEVHRLAAAVERANRGHFTGLSPGYNSLLVRFNARSTTHAEVEEHVREIADGIARAGAAPAAPQRVEIPVTYDGPDLTELAERSSLTVEAFVEAHAAHIYYCYFLGFVPGFAYLGDVPDSIAAPRRSSPRKHVPAGSVGIAGKQTGVYPVASPGGWNLIGHTDVKMFRPESGSSLIRPGNEVRFVPLKTS